MRQTTWPSLTSTSTFQSITTTPAAIHKEWQSTSYIARIARLALGRFKAILAKDRRAFAGVVTVWWKVCYTAG